MAYLRRDQPPLYRDAIRAIKCIAKEMGDTQERALMNEASIALQREDVGMATRLLKPCLDSPNLSQGDRKVLEEYIRSLKISRMFWLQFIAMKVWSSSLILLEKFGLDVVIAIWKFIRESLSVYGNNHGSSRIYTLSTCKQFRFYYCSGATGFCKKSSMLLWTCCYS